MLYDSFLACMTTIRFQLPNPVSPAVILKTVSSLFTVHQEKASALGQKKVLKFYLLDKDGVKHLAATGEDMGDAHYHYRSTKPFNKYGAIDCHNRKELIMWYVLWTSAAG